MFATRVSRSSDEAEGASSFIIIFREELAIREGSRGELSACGYSQTRPEEGVRMPHGGS